MKKALPILVILAIVCCVVTVIGGYVVYNNYILPNTDSESTVTINGQTVKQIRRTPLTFNNEIIKPQKEFIAKIDELNKLNKLNSTKDTIQATIKTVNDQAEQQLAVLNDYKTTLVNYNDYKDFIDAASQFYTSYKTNVNQTYSEANLTIIFSDNISQSEYDSLSAQIDSYNAAMTQTDNTFIAAQNQFAKKYNIKFE